MDKGTIATYGPITALKGSAGRVYELRIKGDEARFIEVLRAAGYEVKDTDEDVMRVFVPGATDDSTKVLFALASKERVQVRHLRPSIPTLEDVFARAVGEA
jgi:ABC-type multidrug transport system ATPase subunit